MNKEVGRQAHFFIEVPRFSYHDSIARLASQAGVGLVLLANPVPSLLQAE
jgi:hypothetical protein